MKKVLIYIFLIFLYSINTSYSFPFTTYFIISQTYYNEKSKIYQEDLLLYLFYKLNLYSSPGTPVPPVITTLDDRVRTGRTAFSLSFT